MSVLLNVRPKCTLAASHAAPWWVTVVCAASPIKVEKRWDKQTDERQSVTLRFSLDAARVII